MNALSLIQPIRYQKPDWGQGVTRSPGRSIRFEGNDTVDFKLGVEQLSGYLLGAARQAGLSASEMNKLADVFKTRRFTVSTLFPTKTADPLGERQDDETTQKKLEIMQRTLKVVAHKVPHEHLPATVRMLFQTLVQTGNFPFFFGVWDEPKETLLCVGQRVMKRLSEEKGIENYQFDNTITPYVMKEGGLLLKTRFAPGHTMNKPIIISLKSPESYRIKPNQKIPFLDRMSRELEGWFRQAPQQQHFSELIQWFESQPAGTLDAAAFKAKLEPFKKGIEQCLGLQPVKMTVLVQRNEPLSDQENERMGTNLQTVSLASDAAACYSNTDKELIFHLDAITNFAKEAPKDKKGLYLTIYAVNSLVHELVHAWQDQVTLGYQPRALEGIKNPVLRDRLMDYLDNSQHYNEAETVLCIKGNIDDYKKQPLEHDAITVSQNVLNAFSRHWTPNLFTLIGWGLKKLFGFDHNQ